MGYELTRGTLASKKRNVIQVHGRQLNRRDFWKKIEVFEAGIIDIIRFYLPVGKGERKSNGESKTWWGFLVIVKLRRNSGCESWILAVQTVRGNQKSDLKKSCLPECEGLDMSRVAWGCEDRVAPWVSCLYNCKLLWSKIEGIIIWREGPRNWGGELSFRCI